MKNKHLVLLFLIALLVGLALREAPWRDTVLFTADLLKIDTSSIQQIQVSAPDKSPIYLIRTENGWAMEQANRHVQLPAHKAQVLLTAIANLRSIRIIKTNRPDTLGFADNRAVVVNIHCNDGKKETIRIGRENAGSAYVELPNHDGIYLTNVPLRSHFLFSINDFRNRSALDFKGIRVTGITLKQPGKKEFAFKKDTLNNYWTAPGATENCPSDSVQNWLNRLGAHSQLEFADWFDESQADALLHSEWFFECELPENSFLIKLFYPGITRPATDLFGRLVLHSSKNPDNYFAMPYNVLFENACPFAFLTYK